MRISRTKKSFWARLFSRKRKYATVSTSKKRPNYSNDYKKRKLTSVKNKIIKLLKILILLLIVLSISILIVSVLFSTAYYLKTGQTVGIFKILRKGKKKKETELVIGLQNVPVFPQSKFIFESIISSASDIQNTFLLSHPPKGFSTDEIKELYTYLNNGNSVYFITGDAKWEDVKEYYKKTLPNYGWDLISDVPHGVNNKLPGLYFYNEKEDKGLRIYSYYNDIWYETLNHEQTLTALAERAYKIQQKNFEVKLKSGTKVSSNTFWNFTYPKTWNLIVSKSPILKVPELYFKKLESVEAKTPNILQFKALKYTPKPVVDLDYKDIEPIAKDALTRWLAEHESSLKISDFKRKDLVVANAKAVEYCSSPLVDTDEITCILIVPNKKNTIFYSITFTGDDITFYNYLKEGGLKPVK